jgi:hypothetical protein
MSNQFWFKPKTYGYGVTPSTWEGWAVVAVYILVFFASTLMLADPQRSAWTWFSWFAVLAVATASMVLISLYKTDGAWRWRWGTRENSRNVS